MEKKTAENQGDRMHTPSIHAYHDLKPYVYGGMHSKMEKSLSKIVVLPKEIVFYRNSSPLALVIGPPHHADQPKPSALFNVSIHMGSCITNKSETPQIQLHNGPKETYPLIGDVRFRALKTSEITIGRTSQGNPLSKFNEASMSDLHVELTKKGALTADIHAFSLDVPSAEGTLKERFEWRHSGSPEVKTLATENVGKENYSGDDRGLKLVNVRTKELIAVFAGGNHHRANNPMKIAGKLRFISTEEAKESEEFQKVVVLSILSIMERGRRQAVSNASSCGECIIL